MALYFLNIMNEYMCCILKSNLTFTLNHQALKKKLYHQKMGKKMLAACLL